MMNKAIRCLLVAFAVGATACSGSPTEPTSPPPPEFQLDGATLTSDDVSFVEGGDVRSRLNASGNVIALNLESLGIAGRARGTWQLSAAKSGDVHRVEGELRLRARTADDREVVVRAQVRRAALREEGEALRFAAVARVRIGDERHGARVRGTIVEDGRLRLQLFFRDGSEGRIAGSVESLEVG